MGLARVGEEDVLFDHQFGVSARHDGGGCGALPAGGSPKRQVRGRMAPDLPVSFPPRLQLWLQLPGLPALGYLHSTPSIRSLAAVDIGTVTCE
jgi:hypothetical protein